MIINSVSSGGNSNKYNTPYTIIAANATKEVPYNSGPERSACMFGDTMYIPNSGTFYVWDMQNNHLPTKLTSPVSMGYRTALCEHSDGCLYFLSAVATSAPFAVTGFYKYDGATFTQLATPTDLSLQYGVLVSYNNALYLFHQAYHSSSAGNQFKVSRYQNGTWSVEYITFPGYSYNNMWYARPVVMDNLIYCAFNSANAQMSLYSFDGTAFTNKGTILSSVTNAAYSLYVVNGKLHLFTYNPGALDTDIYPASNVRTIKSIYEYNGSTWNLVTGYFPLKSIRDTQGYNGIINSDYRGLFTYDNANGNSTNIASYQIVEYF